MNFDYLQSHKDLATLYKHCQEAEALATVFPTSSAISSRKAMEYIVKLIYSSCIGTPLYSMTVFEMVTEQAFMDRVRDETILSTIHIIRKMGNVAAHDGTLTMAEAMNVLENLHFLVGETCILLGLEEDYPEFVAPGTAATPATAPAAAPAAPAKPAGPAKPVEPEKEKIIVEPEIIAKYGPRMRNTHFDVKHGRDESANRELYLKASLREAGWPVVSVPNQGLPGAVGCMIRLDSWEDIDYVMYGKDGRPLAIVEYTATCRSPVEGRLKAIDKANQLSQKCGYKPIAYYTNGYHIYVIDQLGYPPRRVFQFHSIEELELLKLRATIRQDISNPQIDDNITGRYYQKEAITACCRAFMDMRRSSLLVMATGTGKTRVSISLADVMLKANWAKNVLFLADRTSLVRQAHKNFNKLLPSVTTSIYSGGSMSRDPNARIIFSTYQTMINLIDDDTREFGIGRFDLIIIDEAHRSVFNKYGALFHYFDALMIGLTATPRNEENKSTYDVFRLPNGKPDYAYELERAIADKYLVGFSVLDKTTDKMRRGVTYDELTDEEKAKFEDAFLTDDNQTDFSGTTIEAKKIGKRVINLGTIDAMLNDLMKNGLKINAGDRIGKTIIFAYSHEEAVQIVLRFQKIYANLGPDFCKLIDSHVENNLTLIDAFGERDSMPQIAVSVDMMDTGIDVPDVLNLVFFKPVGSKIKFLQMIGRGTRLCADVFGPGMDKQGFLIFDYFDNFRYFSTGNTWSTVESSSDKKTYAMTPQSVLLNQNKLKILRQLQEMQAPSAFEKKYRKELETYFIDTMQTLCNDSIEVQYNMAYVSKYRTAENWTHLTDRSISEIEEHILYLLPPSDDPAKVKSFDLIIYRIEAEYIDRMEQGKDPRKIRHGFYGIDRELTDRMQELLKLKTIPDVVKKEALITSMIHGDYLLDNFSMERAEQVRKDLRDLMVYIPDKPSYYIIDTTDWILDDESGGSSGPFVQRKTYKEKAQEYIDKDSPALAKLRNLDELTEPEKNELNDVFTVQLGTLADYNAWSGNRPLLPFLRIQAGINETAIQTKFGSFLNRNTLSEQQLIFMNQIISYARTNGDITAADLLKVSPFCDTDIMGLFGPEKFGYVKQLINGLHKPVM